MNEINPLEILKTGNVPSFPTIVSHLLQLQAADADFVAFADLLNTDVSLTPRRINCANSAFYGTGSEATTSVDAIRRLGQERILAIVTSATLCEAFPDVPGFDMHEFWEESLVSAILARRLFLTLDDKAAPVNPLLMFLCQVLSPNTRLTAAELYNLGLLCNVGRIMSLLLTPSAAMQLCESSAGSSVYRFSHTCLYFWQFPETFRAPLLYIDEPMITPEYIRKPALVLNTALWLRKRYMPRSVAPLVSGDDALATLAFDHVMCRSLVELALQEAQSLVAFIFHA